MKTNLDVTFKTDPKLAEEGVVFAINDDISFKVRHLSQNNPRVKAAFTKYYKPYARQVELQTLDPKKDREIQAQIFVDTCLVGWIGVESDGKPLEFTRENALKLFEELPELFDTLWRYGNDFQNYREDLGNS